MPTRLDWFLSVCILLFLGSQSNAQPSIVVSATAIGNSATATIARSGSTNAGDLIVLGLMYEKGSSETITIPTGFTQILRRNNGTDAGMILAYKVAGATEPGTYNFVMTDGSKWSMGMVLIRDYDATSPIEASNSATSNGRNVNAPSVTTTTDDCLILCYYTNKKDATFTPHASTTEIYDRPNTSDGQPANMLAFMNQASSGATGNMSARASETEKGVGAQVAIRPASSLPIELLNFQAFELDGHVRLNWSVASEINNAFFSLERSEDGINYEMLTTKKGRGNAFTVKDYSFVDTLPKIGYSYYRLRQIDFDGSSKAFDPELVYIDPPEVETVLLNNPVENKCLKLSMVTMLSKTTQKQEVVISLNTYTGTQLYLEVRYLENASELQDFYFPSDIKPGKYILNIQTKQRSINRPILIL